MLRLISAARTVVLSALWLCLSAVWGATIFSLWQAGDISALAVGLTDVALLGILFLAEGLELAVADLLDKDPGQIADLRLRRLLHDIQQHTEFFFANRQVFVVVIISFMSLTTTYTSLYVPGIGHTAYPPLLFWFPLLFTTLTVLWFAQVTPKRLAVTNSELFLAQSGRIWPLVKLVGGLGLPTPSNLLVKVIQRQTGYSRPRHLLPSRAVLYSSLAQLYGYALDRCDTQIVVNTEGHIHLKKRMMFLFMHNGHGELHGSLDASMPSDEATEVKIHGLYRAPLPERFDAIGPALDKLFDGTEEPGAIFSDNLLSKWRHSIEVYHLDPNHINADHQIYWVIKGERLPEALLSVTGSPIDDTGQFIALIYEIEADLGRAPTIDGQGAWSEPIGLPCRLLTVQVQGMEGNNEFVVPTTVEVVLENSSSKLESESQALTSQYVVRRGALSVAFPVPNASYTVHWDQLKQTRFADLTGNSSGNLLDLASIR